MSKIIYRRIPMKKCSHLKLKLLIGFLILLLLNSSILSAEMNGSNNVSKSNMELPSTWGIVNHDGINIRQYPDPDSQILGIVDKNDVLIVTGKFKKWYRICYKNKSAWIYSQYLEGCTLPFVKEIVPITKEEALREQIVHYAKQFIGTPYCYGGTDLKKGVDCSGFTQAVMKNFGISIHRTASGQFNNGILVKKADLSPADLVFFDTSGRNDGDISHVGLYIGNNQFIHATTAKGVKIDDLSQSYYKKRYVLATSVINKK
ncbi:SH3 domain-containing protein [Defluviitalea raffinosedens]|uniref:SH3 domain-containing protein n=2 Tax=Defluviitalea raffinosedens TaxID=1450156 RepID=A0A7C8HI87_9FIRM|nr:SH3 domain-containing protein [Defluviitalea raffinosedens]